MKFLTLITALSFFLSIGVKSPLFAQDRNVAAYYKTLSTSEYRGCKFKFSGLVRTEVKDTTANARLWVRVDTETGTGFFENMEKRPIKKDTWDNYTIEGTIDDDAEQIAFGVLVYLRGMFYYDNLQLDIETKNKGWVTVYKNNFEQNILDLINGGGIKNLEYYCINALCHATIERQNDNHFFQLEGLSGLEKLAYVKEDSIKVYTLYNIGEGRKFTEKEIEYIEKGFDLSKKIGFEKGQYYYYMIMARGYNMLEKYDKGMTFVQKSFDYTQQKNWISHRAEAADGLAQGSAVLNKLEDALKYRYIALKDYEYLKDKPAIAKISSDIASTLTTLKNYKEAIKYQKSALNIYSELNQKAEIVGHYARLGRMYFENDNIDSAEAHLKKSLELAKGLKEQIANRWKAYNYRHLGRIYLKKGDIASDIKDEKVAEHNYQQSLDYFQNAQINYKNSTLSQISTIPTNIDMGISHFKLKNYIVADSLIRVGLNFIKNRASYSGFKIDAELYLF